MALNHITLMGRLTRDVELKQTPTGKEVCNFTIAVDDGYGDNKKTYFFNMVAWNATAKFIGQYFGKGDLIAVEGKLTTRQYEKDGDKRTITEVLVSQAHFCGGKSETSSERTERSTNDFNTNVETTFGATETNDSGGNEGFYGFMDNEFDLPF